MAKGTPKTAPKATKNRAPKGRKVNAAAVLAKANEPAAVHGTPDPAEGAPVVVAAAPVAPVVRARIGVAPNRPTRPYYAGRVLARLGHGNGVNAAVLAAVDTDYGDAIPRESRFAARNAYHAIRGYLAELGLTVEAVEAMRATPAPVEAGEEVVAG